MKLTFYGATRTTTGSKYLLEINSQQILIECGLFQGFREESLARNSTWPFDPARLNAVLVSHAHIDHTGLLPRLSPTGFDAPIYCTAATADLSRIMLLDSAHIQEQDAAFMSKRNAKKNLPPVEPLYTQADAEAVLQHFRGIAYNQPVTIADGVVATWLDAGHILGSAMIVLDLTEGARHVRFAFSGDLGRGRNDILRDPDHPREVDYLMMETTYGNRVHESFDNVNDRVCAIINRAVEQNGKIIIPSFSVGRTQQLLYTLYQLTQTRCIPVLPIFVDSPLAAQATEVFRHHPECFNKQFYDVMMNEQNPFSMRNLHCTQSVEESIALNNFKKPCIIISASGMAEAGRIRHHIKNNIEDKRNTIMIVGWCAPHTLGSRLASGHKEVNIFGEPYRVRAQVETFDAFSGHADKGELSAWTEQITGPLRRIFLIHGEEEAAAAFASTLREQRPQADILIPNFQDSVEL